MCNCKKSNFLLSIAFSYHSSSVEDAVYVFSLDMLIQREFFFQRSKCQTLRNQSPILKLTWNLVWALPSKLFIFSFGISILFFFLIFFSRNNLHVSFLFSLSSIKTAITFECLSNFVKRKRKRKFYILFIYEKEFHIFCIFVRFAHLINSIV